MFSNDDLIAIEKAIASGTLRVRFSDKEVTYQSIPDLIRARQAILRQLAPSSNTRFISTFEKGLN